MSAQDSRQCVATVQSRCAHDCDEARYVIEWADGMGTHAACWHMTLWMVGLWVRRRIPRFMPLRVHEVREA